MDKSLKGSSAAARMIWSIGSPIIFTVGVLGNVLTIVVLSHGNIRKTSTNIYLTGMAFADLIVMVNTLPRWWFIHVFDVDVRLFSDFSCKTHWFFGYIGGLVSALIIAAVTIERIISTVRPHEVKTICTTKTAFVTTCLLFAMSGLICCHIFYGFELMPLASIEHANKSNSTSLFGKRMHTDSENGTAMIVMGENIQAEVNNITVTKELMFTEQMCVWFANKNYEKFYMTIFQTVILILSTVIPQTILIFGGIVIARRLAISKKLRKQMTNHGKNPNNRIKKVGHLDNQSTQVTKTLMLVNVTFFVCVTPVQVFMQGRSTWVNRETGMNELQEVIWAIVNMMYYINYAINFILYFLSGTRFRQEVMSLFKCRSHETLTNISQSRIATVAVSSSSAFCSSPTRFDYPADNFTEAVI